MDSTQMPKYRCHKEVWALKIKSITIPSPHGGAIIHPVEEGYVPFEVDQKYLKKHTPEVGGYFVVYAPDGYQSFSPAAVFESGYTRL